MVALTLAGVSMLWVQPSAAGICGKNNIAQERCAAATKILRRLLLLDDKKTSQPLNSPLPRARPSTQTAANEQAPVSVIIVPYPTPRAQYSPENNRSSRAPAALVSRKGKTDIDPTTTAGIFKRCLDVDKINEPDIRAQRRILGKKNFCITEKKVSENGLNWRIFTIQNSKKKSGPLFVVPHDNENSAFVAGVYALRKYGGSLVAVESGERRIFKGQDPNRNFGTTKATAKRCRMQRAPAPKYTRAILKSRKRGRPIIALHSNANGWSGNGGSGNISIRRKGDAIPFVSAIARSRRLKDEDTLIVLASKKPPGKDRKLARKVAYFTKKAGVNVLYEHVTPASNDCSLSNYVTLKGLGTYFNIEVETGDVKTQKKIIDIVMQSL